MKGKSERLWHFCSSGGPGYQDLLHSLLNVLNTLTAFIEYGIVCSVGRDGPDRSPGPSLQNPFSDQAPAAALARPVAAGAEGEKT